MHGSGVEGEDGVAEGQEGAELGDIGAAGDGSANVSGGGTDGFDGGGVGGGADVEDVAAEVVMGVTYDVGEAVDVPAGALAAAVLGDDG